MFRLTLACATPSFLSDSLAPCHRLYDAPCATCLLVACASCCNAYTTPTLTPRTGGNANTNAYNGRHFNDHCCFDYGNAETNNKDDGPGTMEAIYFGNKTAYWSHQPDPAVAASGGFVMVDLEKGMYGGNDTVLNLDNTPINATYVTAMLKGRAGNFVLKGGDAGAVPAPAVTSTSASAPPPVLVPTPPVSLRKLYDGCRPQHCVPGKWGKGCYEPMRKQGSVTAIVAATTLSPGKTSAPLFAFAFRCIYTHTHTPTFWPTTHRQPSTACHRGALQRNHSWDWWRQFAQRRRDIL